MSINCQANYNNMQDSSRHEWIQSTLIDDSLLGKVTKSEKKSKNPDKLEFQHISPQEVVPYILIPQHGSKPRKQFQARTSYRRDWECSRQSYRQEKLTEAVQRKQILDSRSTFSGEVHHAMGILHVQSLLLQKLAREESKATEHPRANSELSPTEETNPQLATITESRDLPRDVGSAVATLWIQPA